MRRIFSIGVIFALSCFFTSLVGSQTTSPMNNTSVSHLSAGHVHAVGKNDTVRGHFRKAGREIATNYRKGGTALVQGGRKMAEDTIKVEPLRGVAAFGEGTGMFAKDLAVGTGMSSVSVAQGTAQAGSDAGTRTVRLAKSAGSDTQQASLDVVHGTAQAGGAIGEGAESLGSHTKALALRIDHKTNQGAVTATQDAKNAGQKVGDGTVTVADNVGHETQEGINAVKRTFGRVF